MGLIPNKKTAGPFSRVKADGCEYVAMIDNLFEIHKKKTPSPERSKPRKRPAPRIREEFICPRCGEEYTVRWRRRWWCICCDELELFGEGGER